MTRPEPEHRAWQPAPHPALRGLVEAQAGWESAPAEGTVHHGLPGTSVTVVLSLDAPLDVAWPDRPATRRRLPGLAAGLHLEPSVVRGHGPERGVQLALTPTGCRRLLGVPAAALAGELVDLDDLDGLDRLVPELADAPTWPARFALLERHLVRRALAGAAEPVSEVEHAWRLIVGSGGRQRVADVGAQVGWGRRQLLGRFRTAYGLAPKELARVARFEAARRLAASGLGLAAVAARTGYADQSHLNREWRALAGRTPTGTLGADYQPEDVA